MNETKASGSIGFGVLHTFIKNTGGYLAFLIYVTLAAVGAYYKIFAVRYIFLWAAQFEEHKHEKWTKMGIFSAILYGYCTLAIIRTAMYMKLGVRLSRKMHSNMIFRVLHAPVEEFIEVVSKGRIINRFTKDINVVDRQLMKIAIMAIFKFSELMVAFYFMSRTLSLVIFADLAIFFLVSLRIQSNAMKTKREVVRLEAISKSPIVTWATSSIKGLAQIRTSLKQNYFVTTMKNFIENNLKNSVLIYGLDCWFQLRIALFNIFFVQLPAYAFIVYSSHEKELTHDDISNIALFLILATALTDDVIVVLQNLSEFEASLISIERCEFFNNIPYETGY
jgi:ABC-type multidrug transport system fused ATPase/permease subunit